MMYNGSSLQSTSYDRWIVGAAVFDWNGLPIQYFVPSEAVALPWEEAVFEALGLQALLLKFLKLEGFSSARVISNPIDGVSYSAVVMRRREHYLALLIDDRDLCLENPEFRSWLDRFEVIQLQSHPRFQTVV